MCVRGIYFISISTMFLHDFEEIPTVWYFMPLILLTHQHSIIYSEKMVQSDTGHCFGRHIFCSKFLRYLL